jgi:hypothetical protein
MTIAVKKFIFDVINTDAGGSPTCLDLKESKRSLT